MTVKGIHATDWQQFHPDQFVNIWQFSYSDDRDLTFYCDGRISDVLAILGGKDLEDFVLEPVDDLGVPMTVKDSIDRNDELPPIDYFSFAYDLAKAQALLAIASSSVK